MEKAFFILGTNELLCNKPDYNNELIREIYFASLPLVKEIAIQRTVLQEGIRNYRPVFKQILSPDIIDEARRLFIGHQIVKNKELTLPTIKNGVSIAIDQTLVVRILVNMIKNALEAVNDEGKITPGL